MPKLESEDIMFMFFVGAIALIFICLIIFNPDAELDKPSAEGAIKQCRAHSGIKNVVSDVVVCSDGSSFKIKD